MEKITIRDIKTILTAPAGINLVVVKVETSEPGLFGLGCATFTQRYLAVHTAIEEYLKPLFIGWDVDRIEEIWHTANVSPYWRNGPVLNNAISGLDMALWDIKGKRAGMPCYALFGGKVREGAAVYRHADGRDVYEVEDRVRAFLAEGVRYVRIQMGGYGGAGQHIVKPEGAPEGAYFHPDVYARSVPKLFEHMRVRLGEEVELLHDVHERLQPAAAIRLAREIEDCRPFFLEDALAPEDNEYFRLMRQKTTTPLAMGELYNNPREFLPVVTERLIDYIRVHVSQIGGITPARKLAAVADAFAVRTAWHGPGDVSPVGHAANVHMDVALHNFGIQEWCGFSGPILDVFPGIPEVKNGYVYPNDKPGLGIDLDEESAKKFPCKNDLPYWTRTRTPDGTPVRP